MLTIRSRLRLATSRLANIFGNGTMCGHDKNLKRAKTPEINQIYRINRAPNARASFEAPGVPEPEEIVRRTLRKSNLGSTACFVILKQQ